MDPFVSLVTLGDKICPQLASDLKYQTYQNFEFLLASEEGIVAAMNCVLEKAKGEIIVRIDEDVRVNRDWLEHLLKPFEDPNVCAVTCPTYVPVGLRKNRDSLRIAENPNWFFRWMWEFRPYLPARIYPSGAVSYGSSFEEKMEKDYNVNGFDGACWAMRTELIRKVGGFDPLFGGVAEWFDNDALYRIFKTDPSLRLAYAHDAVLWHLVSTDTKNFSNRTNGWSRIGNWLRFHRRHSKWHYKKGIWLLFLTAYALKSYLFRR